MASSVFRFRNRSHVSFRLDGESGPVLRYPVIGDYLGVEPIARSEPHFLEPWEPRWAQRRPDTRHSVTESSVMMRTGRPGLALLALFICLKSSGRLAGGVTLGAIRRGAAESCTLGYWMAQESTPEKGSCAMRLKPPSPCV
jgi:ribosomal-protein-alanine N-acetyltransferase